MARMSAGQARALVAELENLKGRFDSAGAPCRRKLELLAALRGALLRRPADLCSYHDSLLFLRAYPDSPEVLEEAERQLAGFGGRVAAYGKTTGDTDATALLDSGIVGTPASNVFTYRFVGAMARLYPGRLDVDWDAYNQSECSNALAAISPIISWHENDAIDNDERFEPQAWLRLGAPSGENSLDALLRLLATSGLTWELQRTLYDGAKMPVVWRLADHAASRTGRRVAGAPTHYVDGPPLPRTADLRADLARPAAPLKPVSGTQGRKYVRAIAEVLGSRVRELYPLIGASPGEVALFEPGRGVRIVVYGSLPEIRLPLEANFGVMLVRSGVPIGYGIGAMLFDRCEIAINVFPEYRSGESAFVIEKLIHLFAAHFGARVMLIRPYQIGKDNEEALESGSFWFYYKLGFRPVQPRVRALAEEEAARIATDRSYRCPRAALKKLAASDMFFHLDASQMNGYRELKVARVGYAVTRFIAGEFGGDRRMAERESVRRVAAWLGLSGWRHWTPDEVRALHRMAPMFAAMPDVERWSRRDKALLVRVVRAKGSARERTYALLAERHGTFRAAVERLANAAVMPRRRPPREA
jgi:hypothetical protein